MFSTQLKREIATAVQKILRDTNHPELPATGEIRFLLHVDGAEGWSWADIRNNGAVPAEEDVTLAQPESRQESDQPKTEVPYEGDVT